MNNISPVPIFVKIYHALFRAYTRRVTVCACVLVLALLCGGCTAVQVHLPKHDMRIADVNPHPRKDLRMGGSINVPIVQWPETFNPHHIDGTTGDLHIIESALLPSPMKIDSQGQLHLWKEYFPDITSVITHGHQVIYYTIHPQAHWSDGSPITWRDLYAMWVALRGSDARFIIDSPAGYSAIASVSRGIDDKHAIVVMKQPYGDWKLLFTLFVSARDIATPQDFNTGMLRRFPLTAGPFKVARLDLPTQTVVLTRDPTWWGKPAVLDTIRFRIEDPQGGINPFLAHEYDQFSTGGDASNIMRAQKSPHTTLRWGLIDLIYHLQFNCVPRRITHDKAVRQAIMWAIDREFAEKVSYSTIVGEQLSLSNNHIFLLNKAGYQDNSHHLHYDPQRANQILDAAGWKRGKHGFRWKNHQQLQLTMVAASNVMVQVRAIYQVIQTNLAKVGIRLLLQLLPSTQIFGSYINVGNFDIAFFRWEPTLSLLSDARTNFYLDPACVEKKPSCVMGSNFGLAGNSDINALIDRASVLLDDTARTAALNQLDAKLWEEASDLPLFQQPVVIAQDSRLANIGNDPLGVTDWENVGWLR